MVYRYLNGGEKNIKRHNQELPFLLKKRFRFLNLAKKVLFKYENIFLFFWGVTKLRHDYWK